MKVMIIGLFGVSLAATLSELLLVRGEGQGIRQALRLLTSLAVLLVVAEPLIGFLRSDRELALEGLAGESEPALQERYQAVFEDAVTAGSEVLLTDGIGEFLTAEYGIAAEDATVRAVFDGEGGLQTVYVRLSGSALLQNPDEISDALAERLGCTVEVR